MSNRVSKSKRLPTLTRLDLTTRILRRSFAMPTPYSAYATRNLSYIVSPTESSRYLKYIRRGLSRYDVLGITPR